MKKTPLFALGTLTLLLSLTAHAPAQPGKLIKNVRLPVRGSGVSVAVDCADPRTRKANVYYTLSGQAKLYVMDSDGKLLKTLDTKDANGRALQFDEMAYDVGRDVLWTQLHGSNPVKVYTLDPDTGRATFKWDSRTRSVGTFRDGIAYDASDDTLFITGDVSRTIEHYKSDGTFIRTLTPKNSGGGTLGLISGVTVGRGDLLYLGQNGRREVVQVKKSNGDFIKKFASPGGARDEGLECDALNFFPKLALWSREFNSPGFISVIELEPDTCSCGGVQNDCPDFVAPTPKCGSRQNASVGVPFKMTIRVSDLNRSDRVTLSVAGAPAGATFSPKLPTTGAAGAAVQTVMTWTPSNNQQGCHDLVFTASDDFNPPCREQCKITICVAECFYFLGGKKNSFPITPNKLLYVWPDLWYPVTMTQIPSFGIPNWPTLKGLHLYGQVVMRNPLVFPKDPIKVSNGVDFELGTGSTSFGKEGGIKLWAAEPPVLGGNLRVKFSIDGM